MDDFFHCFLLEDFEVIQIDDVTLAGVLQGGGGGGGGGPPVVVVSLAALDRPSLEL